MQFRTFTVCLFKAPSFYQARLLVLPGLVTCLVVLQVLTTKLWKNLTIPYAEALNLSSNIKLTWRGLCPWLLQSTCIWLRLRPPLNSSPPFSVQYRIAVADTHLGDSFMTHSETITSCADLIPTNTRQPGTYLWLKLRGRRLRKHR